MGKPSAPQPVDPVAAAGAQTGQNISTAIANNYLGNMNQTTPLGSVRYEDNGTYDYTDPATGETYQIPMREMITELSPSQQYAFENNQETQGILSNIGMQQANRIGDHLSRGVDTSGLPAAGSAASVGLPQFRSGTRADRMGTNFDGEIADAGGITRSYNTDFSEDRQRVEDALMSRLNPSLDRDRETLRTSLLNQGLREGTEAFDRALNRANEQATDARMQAILAGGQEQSRMVGLEAQRAGFENQAQNQQFGQNAARTGQRNAALRDANAARTANFANDMTADQFANQSSLMGFNADMARQQAMTGDRQAAMGELFGLRNQPLNEISALMSGSQVSMPNFGGPNTPQMPTVDQAGLMMDNFNQRQANYQSRMGTWNNTMGGLFGLGSAFI